MKKREIIEQVRKIILKHVQPKRIYLFGSQINGEQTPNSDIDIAYDSEDTSKDYLIKDEVDHISTLLKVDVINISRSGDRFRQRVLDTGKVIWSSTKLLRMEDSLLNFQSALAKFKEMVNSKDAYENDGYGDVFLDIAVKRFEFTFEMAWKTCKRTLDYLGFDCKSPRECLKEAYAQNILKNEALWLDMIEQRNLSAHVYDETSVSEIYQDLIHYLSAFEELGISISKLYSQENRD
ncbi:MAG: nucleotidyltransferase substrate binding protein [Marinilabiliaceae bacterium]|nr:nucleotidyltransferase substrate binding protein [Marinilabiliaceae bacterium]